MNEHTLSKSYEKYVNKTYIQQGMQNIQHRQHILENLIEYHRLPKHGLDDSTIEYILNEISYLDSNNFYSNVGVGEREGRVFSQLVHRRHYGLSHGIGRSGDLIEVQPKAAGSSLLYKLTNKLVYEALKIAGLTSTSNCLIVPLATGMTLGFILRSISVTKSHAKYVLWPRIDQKSCFKAILFAGLIPIIVENIVTDGQLQTNITELNQLMESLGSENILAIISTTSCFAPRQPDRVDEIGKLCKQYDIHHIINNAYGLQCPQICKRINRAITIGRVDAVVQSTDKNFLVPVGGAIISSSSKDFITQISSIYPGRANSTPIIDLFITLLSMGEIGYQNLLQKRQQHFMELQQRMFQFATQYHGTILSSPQNEISIAIQIPFLYQSPSSSSSSSSAAAAAASYSTTSSSDVTFFGSMLFQREISGCRVVTMFDKITNIAGYSFKNWGSHCDSYDGECKAYFTVAAAIGMKDTDVTIFLDRLHKVTKKFSKRFISTSDITTVDSNVVDINEGNRSEYLESESISIDTSSSHSISLESTEQILNLIKSSDLI